MTFKNRLTNIVAVAASSTATLTIPVGKNAPTLDRLQFTLSGAGFTDVDITGIRGFVNGREVYREGSATLSNTRRTYHGQTVAATGFVLDFTEPNARSAIEQNLSAWPLSAMQDCRFEFDIGAGAGVAPVMRCLAHFRAPTNNPFIKKQRQITQGFANAGEQIVYIPTKDSGGKLNRVWLHEGIPGNITAVELRAGNVVGIEGTRAELQETQTNNGLVPQAGILTLDFIEDGNLAGWFDTSKANEIELRITGTAADTYTIFYEYTDPIGRL